MTEYLLAAEADQIQSFIFRSAKLREARGASRMLDDFCREVPDILAEQMSLTKGTGLDMDIISHAGGAFRIVFKDHEKAVTFGDKLVEMYRRITNASMSVTKPAPFEAGGFVAAQKQANHDLRRVKLNGHLLQSTAHLPQAAFCASCGVELATSYKRRHADERANYLCDSCQKKAGIGVAHKRDGTEVRDPADEIARFDPRRYVAYLKADGNSMGKWFNECDREELRALSKGLDAVMRASLITSDETITALVDRLSADAEWSFTAEEALTPLLLAGDDCFAILPAPYALDFARRFCFEFGRGMAELLNKPPLDNLKRRLIDTKEHKQPSITAALVICKSSYPYTLAHERAEALLKAAKKVGKAADTGSEVASLLDFELIVGNEVTPGNDGAANDGFVTRGGTISLRPYWVIAGKNEPEVLRTVGLNVQHLLAKPFELRNYPRGRIAQLRKLYEVKVREILNEEWRQQWAELRDRVMRFEVREPTADEKDAAATSRLNQAWRRLGDDNRQPGELTTVARVSGNLSAHGLPDLIEMWDFAYSLDRAKQAYMRRVE